MAVIVSSEMHRSIAEQFYTDLATQRGNYYYFVGATTESFGSADIAYNREAELNVRNSIVLYKKLTINNIAYTIPRIDWVSGMVYDMFDSSYDTEYPSSTGATSIRDANFYVVTDQYNVYKCIDNYGGGFSTVKPVLTGTEVFTTSDGYVWKFMYHIEPVFRKFMTTDTKLIPVFRSVYEKFYNRGTISAVNIDNPGSGYDDTTIIIVDGDGSGAVLTPVVSGGQISDVVIADPGSGYSYVSLTVVGPNGSGGAILSVDTFEGTLNTKQADVEFAAVDGAINAIRVLNGGANYVSPQLVVSGDGVGLEGIVKVINGSVHHIEITNPGYGYSYADVTVFDAGGGTGAVLRGVIAPKGGHGFNAPKEFFTNSVSIHTVLNNDRIGGISINNDYRQFGIIKNLKKYNGVEKYVNLTGVSGFVITVDNMTKYSITKDSLIEDSLGYKYTVIQISGNKMFVLADHNRPITANTHLLDVNRNGIAMTEIIDPTVDKLSGDILFVDIQTAVELSADQVVTGKTLFKF
jgi:hypothetical protein